MPSRSSIVPYLWRTPSLWFGAFLLLLGLPFLLLGSALAIDDSRYAVDGATVNAIVLSKDIHRATGSSGTSYSVRYRFTLPNGQTLVGSSTARDWENLVEGGPVTVQYLVSDPSSNRVAHPSDPIADVVFLTVGAGVFLGGGYLVWLGTRALREDRRLLRVGREAGAQVTAVEPTNIRINWDLQWVISYAYRDADGKEHKGRSPMMPEAQARKFSRGDHATIRYDPDRPAESLWPYNARRARTDPPANDRASPHPRRRGSTIDAQERSPSPGLGGSGPPARGEPPADTLAASRAPGPPSVPDATPSLEAPPPDQRPPGD
jgi:hypothetical protein